MGNPDFLEYVKWMQAQYDGHLEHMVDSPDRTTQGRCLMLREQLQLFRQSKDAFEKLVSKESAKSKIYQPKPEL